MPRTGPPLANHARRHREAAQLTQGALAERAGVSLWTVSRFERGDPSTQTVGTSWAIAQALNTTLDALFGVIP